MAGALSRRGLLLSAAALAACARTAGRSETLRIGYQKNGVLLLAKARGQLPAALAGAGVKQVTWAEFNAGPPMLEAMRAGAIDIGAVGDTPPIFAQAAGSPLVYAAAQPLTGAGSGMIVRSGSAVRSPADLKGRRVAFTKGSSAHLFTIEALARSGLGLKDILPIHLSPADGAAAFASGAIDAWSIWDPFLAIAQQSQGARTIIDGTALARTNGFYLARRAFAETSPKVLSAALDALAAEAAWGNAHRSEVGTIIQAATGLPAAIVDISLRRGGFAVVPIGETVIRAQQSNADTFARIGEIPAPIDIRRDAWTGWTPSARAPSP